VTKLPNNIAAFLLTLAISTVGGGLAAYFGLPAGWLMGGALAVTIAAIAGAPMDIPSPARNVVFILIGMTMGASVAPDSLTLLASWPVSLTALAIELVIIVAVTGWMLTRFAATGVGNPRQIVIIQVIRILMLTIAVPLGSMFLPFGAPTVPPVDVPDLSALQLALLALGCFATGLLFEQLKVPAGMVLGAMAAATAAKLGGLYTEGLPGPLVIATFILTGALIGSRFVGITLAEFIAAAKSGLIATVLTLAIVTLVTQAVAQLVDMPFGQIWLGLSPGALEGMGALGIALGYDTAFIGAHHVIRLLLLSFAIPAVVLIIRRHERSLAQQRHN
jgi:membrane AbrB-like protein